MPPRGVVCYLPGYGSYVGKYGYIAKVFSDCGYDFIGMDYKGYGRSEGIKKLIRDLNELSDDVSLFITKAREFYRNLYPGV